MLKITIKNPFKLMVVGLTMATNLTLADDAEDYLNGTLEIGPFLASNPSTHNYVGPLVMTNHAYFHEFGSYPDIGYFLESPIGLINDNETQFLSLELSTNNLFADPLMHLVLSMSGDSIVRTTNSEIMHPDDVQLSGRGPALGILSRIECQPSNGQLVEAFAVENYTRNRGHGNPAHDSLTACDEDEEFLNYQTYRIDIHANKNNIAYWIFKERFHPILSHWELVYNSGAILPEEDLDQYFGNIIIGTASRSINSSIDLDEVYVAKFGADYTFKPEIDTLTNACLNEYCMTIRGQNFDADAEVWVRKKKLKKHGVDPTPQAPITPNELTIFAGNDIYSRSFSTTEDKVFFPIQNLDLQQAWIDDGLCFSIKNTDTFSNEECHQRVLNPIQPKFMGQDVESYSASQDLEYTSYLVKGDASPLAGGNLLKIMGNSWKKINYNYNITANTVLSFDFRSNQQQPEINAVGLKLAGGPTKYFQVYGTQIISSSNYIQDFHDYQPSEYKTYTIPVGQYFTGNVIEMIFVADEDNHVGQNTTFRNPKLNN